MKAFAFLLSLAALCSLSISKTSGLTEIGIYGGGPLYSGSNPNMQSHVDNLKASGFTTVILWTIHVYSNGDLVYNGATIASNGQYVGDSAWSGYLFQLKSGQTSINRILLSVGSGGVGDFKAIANLIQSQGTGSDSVLYKNFKAIKEALPEVDAIDLDDEDYFDQDTIVNFSLMLGAVGFKVSFCPYNNQDIWINSAKTVNSKFAGLVVQFNLQCYSGGSKNDPVQWELALHSAGQYLPVFPGVMSQQAGGEDPSAIQAQFSNWKSEGITGGFIWLYDNVLQSGPTAEDYASAIIDGL